MRGMGRKFAAIAALVAMLLPGFSTLAQTLSAADLPACCNTTYCPLHHRPSRDSQKDNHDCGSTGIPGQHDSSMRACESTQTPVAETQSFVLVAALTLSAPAPSQDAPAASALFAPFVFAIPTTPPPRNLAS